MFGGIGPFFSPWHLLRQLTFVFAALSPSLVPAQLVSYQHQEALSLSQLNSAFSSLDFDLPLSPKYAIAIYSIRYQTPYIRLDSLVTASGIVVSPQNAPCPLPLINYAHGTVTKGDDVPSHGSLERNIGMFFSSIAGFLTVMPDELGLGDFDRRVPIHPYISGFHLGHASINAIRAARQLADSLGYALNGSVSLTGYSEGGYTTAATHKLMQESYPNEFPIAAAAPMSGSYDLGGAMVEAVLGDAPYPAPAYLPYLLLAYHSVYPSLQELYPNGAFDIFNPPYASVLPPLFYDRQHTLGDINALCAPVPKNMLKDSLLNAFKSDSLHPLRLLLAENSLLNWAPMAPVKLFYCRGDELVPAANSQNAFAGWTARGAPMVEQEDFGDRSHGECVEPALLSAAVYLLSKQPPCQSGVDSRLWARRERSPDIPGRGMAPARGNNALWIALFTLDGTSYRGRGNRIPMNFPSSGAYIAHLESARGEEAFRFLLAN